MKVADLMTEAVSLPLEDRVLFVDSFLQTLNPADNAWKVARLAVARRRLDDFDSGRVSGIPGEAVFERTR